MMISRKFSVLLCVLLFIFIIIPQAEATSNETLCGSDARWAFDAVTGTLTISGTGSTDNFTEGSRYTPSTQPWYDYRDQIINIVISDGITSIGDYAFSNFSQLENVTFPNNLSYIGQNAFKNCYKLQNIYVPNINAWLGITFADEIACPMAPADQLYVNGELLTVLDIPNGVTQIPAYSFNNYQHLTEVKIPGSVKSIGENAFKWCENLEKVTFSEGLEYIYDGAFSRCRALKDFTLPNSLLSIGQSAFLQCYQITSLTIPKNVTQLGAGAVSNCRNLREVILPEGITQIQSGTFLCCGNLESVTISAPISHIGESAFEDCTNLTHIDLGNALLVIGDRAFDDCPLKYLELPDTIQTIGYNAFENTKIRYIYIPSSIESLKANAFEHCVNLEHIYYAGTLKQWDALIGKNNILPINNAVLHCDADRTHVSHTNADTYVCSICDMEFTDGISGICGKALRWRFDPSTGILRIFGNGQMNVHGGSYTTPWLDLEYKITAIILEEGITSVDERCFQYIRNLQYAQLPSSLLSVGNGIFGGCENLHHILYSGTMQQWNQLGITFSYPIKNVTVHYEVEDCEITIGNDSKDFQCSICGTHNIGDKNITSDTNITGNTNTILFTGIMIAVVIALIAAIVVYKCIQSKKSGTK